MINKYLSFLILCLLVLAQPSFAQEDIKELESGYYMTVAAYLSSGEGYAIRYTKKLQDDGFNADYGFTYKKNMYFVYIKYYSDFKVAVNEINSTRKETPFDDAWVYVYKAVKPMKDIVTDEGKKVDEGERVDKIIETPADSTVSIQDTTSVTVTITEEDSTITEEADRSRLIYFEAVHARTQELVDVEITLFDPYYANVVTTIKSGESKRVNPPENDQNILQVMTNTIGWKTDAVSINFNNPVNSSTAYFANQSNDTLALFFEMHKLRKGDVQILFNVYFMSESAIMQPVSKLQLEELKAMMDNDPKYRIKLHGHTNGSASGKYTRLGENDTIFFQTSSKHELTSGSAKKLSHDRANTVKKYLIARGIAADRIEIKGWGGKKQIYDKHSRAAQRNIRVAVEVRDE